MKKVFSSFKDATQFARSLATRSIAQQLKRNMNDWEVHYSENKLSDANREKASQKLKKLEEENENLRDTIDRKAEVLSEKKNLEHDAMLQKLSMEEDQIMLSQRNLDARNEEIRETLRATEQEALDVIKEASTQLEVLEALKTAYTDAFGVAEVNRITREVTEKAICWRCNGDGGAAGQCPKCDGTGMFTETIKVPEYKAMLVSKI
jgi:DNA repair exonuclease SbcCD ATPase subunit